MHIRVAPQANTYAHNVHSRIQRFSGTMSLPNLFCYFI